MRFNSTLISSLQGSTTGGQELEVPELLMPSIELPLPLSGIQNVGLVEGRNVPNSVHIFRVINQGNSLAAITTQMLTLDRGVYQIKGSLFGWFAQFVTSSADPFGAVLQLLAPGGASAVTIAFTSLQDQLASGLSPRIEQFDFTYQIVQPGWILQVSTFHATNATQSIGVAVSAQVNRLL